MKLANKAYWGMGALLLAVFVASFFMDDEPIDRADLPWHIEHPTAATTRVFGLLLGQATAGEAEAHFREEGTASLFKAADGRLVAEMFFEQVTLAGLRTKIVVGIAVPAQELSGMYERGLRIASTGSGKKITLAPDDLARLRALPIASLTYMPVVRLEEEIIAKRFGQPGSRIRETKSGVVHWLYPQQGLDIALGADDKPVLQYVSPGEFDKLLQPLRESGEVLN